MNNISPELFDLAVNKLILNDTKLLVIANKCANDIDTAGC